MPAVTSENSEGVCLNRMSPLKFVSLRRSLSVYVAPAE
jgi:hypothetical protein